MMNESVADAVTRALAERELTLGTVECGTDGIVSRRIFDASDGPAVLGNSLIVDQIEEAIVLLDLPRPQFKKAGDFSAKAARAAARSGRAFLEVHLCLVVWGRAPGAGAVEEQPPVYYVALDTGRRVVDHVVQIERRDDERAMDRLASEAIAVVKRALASL